MKEKNDRRFREEIYKAMVRGLEGSSFTELQKIGILTGLAKCIPIKFEKNNMESGQDE